MSLVTAADFPALFAQPDNSGLARGVEIGLRGVGRMMEQDRLKKAEDDRIKLMSAAQSAAEIRDMSGPNLESEQRMSAYFKQRNAIASLAGQAQRAGNTDVAEYWTEILEAGSPDELNVKLSKLATDGLAASGKIGGVLAQRALARTPGVNQPTNLQRGPGKFAVDADGNKFLVSDIFDPQTGSTMPSITALGDILEPVGQLSFVGGSGVTASEASQIRVNEAEEKEKIKTTEAVEREEDKKEIAFKWDAKIADKVERAKSKANAEGTALTELAQMQAAMPMLRESIQELRDLAAVATHTVGGKIWDAAVQQSGFGATEGATARAKFIAIVNNQVLPLLRQTFGAAFTEGEGNALRATMGDPDATPEAKMAQLDAFIAQKERNIQAKRAEAGAVDNDPLGIR